MQFANHVQVSISATGSAGEQSFLVPTDASNLTFQVRGATSNVQYYFKSHAAGGGPGGDNNYFTLSAGNAKTFINFRMQYQQTIYFQVPAGQTVPAVIEIEYCIS